jgi:hypothetical protein
MNLDDPAAHAARLRVPSHVVADFETLLRSHDIFNRVTKS